MTVAKRLAENKDISVAVVEAGGFYELDSGNFSQIPAYESLYLSAPMTIDWGIYTTPQTVRPRVAFTGIIFSVIDVGSN